MQKHQSSYHLYLEKIVSFKNSIYTIFSAPLTSRVSLTLDVFLPAGGKYILTYYVIFIINEM